MNDIPVTAYAKSTYCFGLLARFPCLSLFSSSDVRLKAVKELKAENEALKARLEALEKKK